MKIEIDTKWEQDSNLIITRLSGPITEADAIEWEKGLTQVLQSLPNGTKFKIFVNFYDLNPSSVSAHKAYRNVMPLLLSQYGWRIGYLDLFEEANGLKITTTNGIQCVAAVHCHQDSYKIGEYERRFGKENEHFYDDPIRSEDWIRNFESLDPVR
ncbi:hypothetical protein EHQ92_02030 [Leptospira biflexa]|uniref:hypothetical protein n=1 Tax=Leptospira biflexa TaxID=172 RepID=UPI001090C608|nr:hypothetical protein [Leptospira biflexa]TGM46726.1 hypothetical protein EHQ92_02030 [Leptospira biflexa]TGM50809.1 hypothetical protein EHQ88_11055 [Leptospira biflexa]